MPTLPQIYRADRALASFASCCWYCACYVSRDFEFKLGNRPDIYDIQFDGGRTNFKNGVCEIISMDRGEITWHKAHGEVITVAIRETCFDLQ